MTVDNIDSATKQWREMFSEQMAKEFAHNRDKLDEIKGLLTAQNSRVRANEIAIAGLKTWVAVVGGLTGVGTIISAAMWLLTK